VKRTVVFLVSLFFLSALLAGCASRIGENSGLPFSLPVLFSGPVPGATDPLFLELRPGRIYQICGGDTKNVKPQLGRFRYEPTRRYLILDSGVKLVLDPDADRLTLLQPTSERTIILQRQGSGQAVFPGPVLIRAVISGKKDDYRARICATGAGYPVSQREGYSYLVQEMETRPRQVDQPLLVEMMGRLAGAPERIVVARVIHAWTDRDCAGNMIRPETITLFDGTWVPQKILDRSLSPGQVRDLNLFLRFNRQGSTVSGFSGCNRFRATFLNRGSLFLFNRIDRGKWYCRQGEEIESLFFQALVRTESYRITAGELQFLDGDKRVVMTLSGQSTF